MQYRKLGSAKSRYVSCYYCRSCVVVWLTRTADENMSARLSIAARTADWLSALRDWVT